MDPMNCSLPTEVYVVRFEVLAAMKLHVEVFWVVTPFSTVAGYHRFRGPRCLRPHPEKGGSMYL
jgi:hypothetical protein